MFSSMVNYTNFSDKNTDFNNWSLCLDPDNLLVEPGDHNTFIIGKQYEPFVIPCKPTAPNVKVELFNEQGEVKTMSDFNNDTEIEFNPEIGIKVMFNESFFYDVFHCKPQAENSNEKTEFFVTVDEKGF